MVAPGFMTPGAWSDSDRSRNAVRPSGAAHGQGFSGAGDFIVTVFFDAGDEREDPSQPHLDVGRQIQRIEGGAGGAKLRFRGLADFGAG